MLTVGEEAYIFYFVHTVQGPEEGPLGSHLRRRSSLQAAGLYVENGQLRVLRDEPFNFLLPDPED